MIRLHFDLETRSEVVLKDTLVYACHESTEIYCIAFSLSTYKTDEAYKVIPRGTNDHLDEKDFEAGNGAVFKALFENELIEKHAWNSTFERLIMQVVGSTHCGTKIVNYKEYHCSMLRAMYANLPAGMGNSALALRDMGVDVHLKDGEGSKTMLDLAKPRTLDKNNDQLWYARKKFPEKFDILYEYCVGDVLCERSISDFLPAIPAQLRAEELCTTRMNAAGLYIDMPALRAAQAVDKMYKQELSEKFMEYVKPHMDNTVMPYDEDAQLLKHNNKESKRHEVYHDKMVTWYALCDTLDTGRRREPTYPEPKQFILDAPTWKESFPDGFAPSQTKVFLAFINNRYEYSFDSMDKETTESFMRTEMPDELRSIMVIRNEAIRTSLTKLKAYLACTAPDGKVYNSIKFYGATMTGRYSGQGIQPQNLPSRDLYQDIDGLFKDLVTMTTREFIEAYRSKGITNVLASSLRGFIKAPAGKKYVQYDFSAIEARVVAWLGDETEDLDAFRDGKCVYRQACMIIFGLTQQEADDLDSSHWMRKVAKVYILSLCYGTGFKSLGEKIYADTKEEVDVRCKCKEDKEGKIKKHKCDAHRMYKLYRESKLGTVHLWHKMGQAALDAMDTEGIVTTAGIFKFVKKGVFLYMRLPSGRTIKYPAATVIMTDRWNTGREIPQIFYRGDDNNKKTSAEYRDANYRKSWRQKSMYGSRFFQHASQGIARDIMAESAMRVEGFDNGKYKVVLLVHDEKISEVDKDADEELIDREMTQLMCESPAWGRDIPLKVEGTCRLRFAK